MKHSENFKKDLNFRAAKPKEKEYTILDGEGLSRIITPSGGKCWIFRYSIDGNRSKIHLGTYPEVPLRGYFLNRPDGTKVWPEVGDWAVVSSEDVPLLARTQDLSVYVEEPEVQP